MILLSRLTRGWSVYLDCRNDSLVEALDASGYTIRL